MFSRVGVYLRLPGVDVERFAEAMGQGGGILGYIDTLSGAPFLPAACVCAPPACELPACACVCTCSLQRQQAAGWISCRLPLCPLAPRCRPLPSPPTH